MLPPLLYSKYLFFIPVFDPCKDNYHTLISNCFSCRCGSTQKQALDLHEPSRSIETNTASAKHGQPQQVHTIHQQHYPQQTNSASNSQHSQNNDEGPPIKIRITNVNTLPPSSTMSVENMTETEQIEPKIDYDDASSPPPLPLPQPQPALKHEVLQHPPLHHQPSSIQLDSQTAHTNTTTALSLSSSTSALNLHNNPDTDEETLYMERELQEQELHLERMHEYFMQQQHQQQHLQHQQHQPHMDALMQESSSSNSLRRKLSVLHIFKCIDFIFLNSLLSSPSCRHFRTQRTHVKKAKGGLCEFLGAAPCYKRTST